MAFEGFGKNTGPIAPPKSQTPFGNPSPPPSTFPPSSSCSDLIFGDQGSFVSQKNQSSPLFQNESPLVPKSTRSPPLVFQNNLHTDGETPPLGEAQLLVWLQLLLSLSLGLF